ncbi:MAG: hypothetical protein AAFO29_20140 [Actinomycetota bacterium]
MERASASDCRSVLLPIMAAEPGRVFTTPELALILQGSSLRLDRRPDQMVFEALRKAEGRGWVVKEGRARYRFGHIPRTTLQRIIRWHQGLELGLSGPDRSAYASWHPIGGAPRTNP